VPICTNLYQFVPTKKWQCRKCCIVILFTSEKNNNNEPPYFQYLHIIGMKRSLDDGKFASHLPDRDNYEFDAFYARVENLRNLHFKWKFIADELGISYDLLRRWKSRNNFVDPYECTNIDDNELDVLVASLSEFQPNRGEVDIMSRLEAANIQYCVLIMKDE
jgi:hypothetical protein